MRLQIKPDIETLLGKMSQTVIKCLSVVQMYASMRTYHAETQKHSKICTYERRQRRKVPYVHIQPKNKSSSHINAQYKRYLV